MTDGRKKLFTLLKYGCAAAATLLKSENWNEFEEAAKRKKSVSSVDDDAAAAKLAANAAAAFDGVCLGSI